MAPLKSLGLSALFALSASALPTISQKGRYFFTSNGDRWFAKGVAYQLYSTGDSTDPYADPAQCGRDAALMKQLGVNSVRTYHVRANLNHDECMKIFDDAGIYVFVDLDDYPTQLNQNEPGWTNSQKAAFESVVDAFAKYDNVAGFFIGNEVINDGSLSGVAVDIKAAIRDIKAYIADKKYRTIPIGYSHADVQSIGQNLEYYFACGDQSSMLDFYGLNSYRWCGPNTFEGSGYVDILNQTANYPIPLIMSETGCNQPEPRLFQDQTALLGPDMNEVWSGAIIYEWLQEENHYGLVTYEGGITDALQSGAPPAGAWPRSGTPTPVTPDFSNLSNAWKTLNPTGTVSANAYSPSLTPLACPTYQAGSWQVSGNAPLPSASGPTTVLEPGDAPAALISMAPATAASSAAASATPSSTPAPSSGSPSPTPVGPNSASTTHGSGPSAAATSHAASTTTGAATYAAPSLSTGIVFNLAALVLGFLY